MLKRPPSIVNLIKGMTSSPVLVELAKALDEAFSELCESAAQAPIVIQNIEATGDWQSIPIGKTLASAPVAVSLTMREPPTIKSGMEFVTAAYKVEYGAHTATTVSVRVTTSAGASKAKYDVFITG